jgi:hypothetical protein
MHGVALIRAIEQQERTMSIFAAKNRYPGFVWLGSRGQNWVARDRVPASLLEPHDSALAALDADPDDMRAAVAWMDACDAIYKRVDPILDGPALQASLGDLRNRGDRRKLDHMLEGWRFRSRAI